jgi:hypothetical protein
LSWICDTQQGSVGLEVAAKQNWLASASYLMVKGTHLQRWRDVNLGTPETLASIGVAGTLNRHSYRKFTLPRPIAGFDRILLVESAASSIYHALALKLDKRYSRGFQLSAAYTFSKTIDDNPEPIAVAPPVSITQTSSCRKTASTRAEWARSGMHMTPAWSQFGLRFQR